MKRVGKDRSWEREGEEESVRKENNWGREKRKGVPGKRGKSMGEREGWRNSNGRQNGDFSWR